MNRHPCAISECQVGAKVGHLMCREHWSQVPIAERREVNDSWHEVSACRKALDLHDRIARYEAAVKAAVDAVMAKAAEPAL